jgi:hypothetical protein
MGIFASTRTTARAVKIAVMGGNMKLGGGSNVKVLSKKEEGYSRPRVVVAIAGVGTENCWSDAIAARRLRDGGVSGGGK